MNHDDEAARLALEYDRAIGDALELRIQVHVRGRMKSLGELRDEIADARGSGDERRRFFDALATAFERRDR